MTTDRDTINALHKKYANPSDLMVLGSLLGDFRLLCDLADRLAAQIAAENTDHYLRGQLDAASDEITQLREGLHNAANELERHQCEDSDETKELLREVTHLKSEMGRLRELAGAEEVDEERPLWKGDYELSSFLAALVEAIDVATDRRLSLNDAVAMLDPKVRGAYAEAITVSPFLEGLVTTINIALARLTHSERSCAEGHCINPVAVVTDEYTAWCAEHILAILDGCTKERNELVQKWSDSEDARGLIAGVADSALKRGDEEKLRGDQEKTRADDLVGRHAYRLEKIGEALGFQVTTWPCAIDGIGDLRTQAASIMQIEAPSSAAAVRLTCATNEIAEKVLSEYVGLAELLTVGEAIQRAATQGAEAGRAEKASTWVGHTQAADLLAILHGDGGHWTQRVGFIQSCLDAAVKHHELLARSRKAHADLEKLRPMLVEEHDHVKTLENDYAEAVQAKDVEAGEASTQQGIARSLATMLGIEQTVPDYELEKHARERLGALKGPLDDVLENVTAGLHTWKGSVEHTDLMEALRALGWHE